MRAAARAAPVACILAALAVASSACVLPKQLIEFGWDEPDTAFLRRHLAEMEKTPFDGCVFRVNCGAGPAKAGSLTWEAWGPRRFSEAECRVAIQDLRSLAPRRFMSNFLRVNVTPGTVDWFDDFGPILGNARLAARLARLAHARGVLLDVEEYESPLFDYRKQRDAGRRSWASYAAQARLRGRETVEAFDKEFRGLTIFLTFGYGVPWRESENGKKPLSEGRYGLLVPFLDGMVEGARHGVRIVDGYEPSYGFREPARFDEARSLMREGVLPIVADPPRYGKVVSAGFGIWLDFDRRKEGWNGVDAEKNYFTPAAFEASVHRALTVTDQYVWIYSETPRWWSAEGRALHLPAAYEDALRRARQPDPK